jgi:zinc-finger of transposase IS204/IS1001/IS1096/IS1165/Helix-turn-helix domain of transposase family ISL3
MSDATSSDPTAVLFGLEEEFGVVSVERTAARSMKVVIEQTSREGPCPACGVMSWTIKERSLMQLKDLPACGQVVELWWRKRRLACVEPLCPRQSFTQTSSAVRPRGRVTERLRNRVAIAIASGNRAVSEVAAEYGVSWPTAHRALVAAAARWLPEPEPTSRLGIDETRFSSVRWILDGGHVEAVGPVADLLRRLFSGWAGIPAGVGSWPHRRLREGLAGRADARFSGRDPDRGHRPVRTVCVGDSGCAT